MAINSTWPDQLGIKEFAPERTSLLMAALGNGACLDIALERWLDRIAEEKS